jgi:hypothetical protein
MAKYDFLMGRERSELHSHRSMLILGFDMDLDCDSYICLPSFWIYPVVGIPAKACGSLWRNDFQNHRGSVRCSVKCFSWTSFSVCLLGRAISAGQFRRSPVTNPSIKPIGWRVNLSIKSKARGACSCAGSGIFPTRMFVFGLKDILPRKERSSDGFRVSWLNVEGLTMKIMGSFWVCSVCDKVSGWPCRPSQLPPLSCGLVFRAAREES